MSAALKQRQKDSVIDVISSVSSPGAWNGESPSDEPSWRVLIYDATGRDIIAPLLKVKELRDLGVTLHLLLEKPRQPISGVPAVYLCEPTEENILRIAKDIVDELYQSFHINFVSQIPRAMLELLAEQLSSLPTISHVRCFDRNLRYIAESNDLFHLLQKDSYRILNSPKTSEADMEKELQKMVLGITNIILSQQTVPIIAHAATGAASELANRLVTAIADLIRDQLLPPTVGSSGRTVLLVSDRSSDISAALHHSFTYRGLLLDALEYKLNKVELTGEDGKPKIFEIDPESDSFFQLNAGLDFGEVGNRVHEFQVEYNAERQELSSQTGEDLADDSESGVSKMLASAPRLAEKKRSLDAHTSLAYAALAKIKARALDMFHGVEQTVLGRERPDWKEIETLLKDKGTPLDKQRLYLILFLHLTDEDSTARLEALLPLVHSDASPFKALSFIKQLRQWSRNSTPQSQSQSTGWKIAQNLAEGLTKSLKSGVTATSHCLVTKVVEALLSESASKERTRVLEGLTGLDPRTKQSVDLLKVKFSQCTVFSLGGGCSAEFDELKEFEKSQGGTKKVLYGSSEILTGEGFLQQLAELATDSS